MGTITSTLVARLIDRVSPSALTAEKSLKRLDIQAGRMGRRTRVSERIDNLIAGGAVGVGAASAAAVALRSYKDFAALDRQFTRIAITANATRKEQDAALASAQKTAQQYAMPFENVVAGVESLVASGQSLSQAMEFLPSVVQTAQATNSEVSDIAKTADALSSSLAISSDQMQHAFDLIAAGGKEGKFETKDMAKYMASLAPIAASMGIKGTEGLKKLVAMLQVVQKQSGNAEEAYTGVRDLLTKMESQEVVNKMRKFGVDVPKAMAKARKSGADLTETFLALVKTATKGDLSKIPQIFTELDSQRAVRALIELEDQLQSLKAELSKNANNVALEDMGRLANDAQAKIDRLSNSWGRLSMELGRGLDTIGVSDELERSATNLGQLLDHIDKARAEGSKNPVWTGLTNNFNEKQKAARDAREADLDKGGLEERSSALDRSHAARRDAERRQGDLASQSGLSPARRRHMGFDAARAVEAAIDVERRAQAEYDDFASKSPAAKLMADIRQKRVDAVRRRASLPARFGDGVNVSPGAVSMQSLYGTADKTAGKIEGAFQNIDLSDDARRAMESFVTGAAAGQAAALSDLRAFVAEYSALMGQLAKTKFSAPSIGGITPSAMRGPAAAPQITHQATYHIHGATDPKAVAAEVNQIQRRDVRTAMHGLYADTDIFT